MSLTSGLGVCRLGFADWMRSELKKTRNVAKLIRDPGCKNGQDSFVCYDFFAQGASSASLIGRFSLHACPHDIEHISVKSGIANLRNIRIASRHLILVHVNPV